jgi:hypothetical protein
LFSTPAYCQVGVCGPVLDILLSQAPTFQDRVQFIHVEVYDKANPSIGTDKDLSPGMRAYHLQTEPMLFLAGPDGVVRETLDGPFDRVEAAAALQRLVA